MASAPNILIVSQKGPLAYQALIFAASLRAHAPGFQGALVVAEPVPEFAWTGVDTRLPDKVRGALTELGATIVPFEARHFGQSYPNGNKIEALRILPADQPFVFFDTDTLITGPLDTVKFDFKRPAASMNRSGTWPQPPLYGPGYGDIWRSLYDRFGLEFESSLDLTQPDEHWERYLYFNAGWFFGADPAVFADRFLNWAIAVRDDPGEALACQTLDPWLDQVLLPLVIHSLKGGRPPRSLNGLDGDISCHYRSLSLLYARESDAVLDALESAVAAPAVRRVLRDWEPARQTIYQNRGRKKIRPLFETDMPPREQGIRQRLKAAGWWLV
ncbi:hypothetical protein [Paracoccus pacificus]|uniref:Uncharacterized protein n=1 Tax=Paracoccus pacificus TaxID=1463598 RepID=A0ABW4RBA3_9RHOB